MIEVKSEVEMQEFGERLGKLLHGGESIELIGDVGAGKTTLVRGLARGMGVTETVQSPSFTINRVYDADGGRRLVHYDFYRLHDAGIMANELEESVNDPNASVVIEWADAVEQVLPDDRLTITIVSPTEFSRELSITSGGDKSNALLEAVK
jgi:tRNA threonylcarbamoyladenosine biosynthesis protein TsaE